MTYTAVGHTVGCIDCNHCSRRSWERKWSYQNAKNESIEEFIVRFPYAKEVMIDGTERPISSPKDQEKQKSHYSGKKKRHTRKHLVMTDQDKRVLVLTKAIFR